MNEFICGMIGVLAGAASFALGSLSADRRLPPPAAETLAAAREEPTEEQRRKTEEEQKAFSALMGYSAAVAYGLESFPGESKR